MQQGRSTSPSGHSESRGKKELPDPGVSNISTSSSAKCHLKHYFSYQQWVLVDKLSS
jgi:hypothetical protein